MYYKYIFYVGSYVGTKKEKGVFIVVFVVFEPKIIVSGVVTSLQPKHFAKLIGANPSF